MMVPQLKVWLIRFSELFLHGIRRGMLIKRLMANIKAALPKAKLQYLEGRVIVKGINDDEAAELSYIFGVHSYVKAIELKEPKGEHLKPLLDPHKAYKVEVKKANTHWKEGSLGIMKRIAKELEESNYKMSVKEPEDVIHIEMRRDRAFAYLQSDVKKGPGGFPYGSYGKGLVLFSGGFDSPVASWMAARKGLKLEFLMVSPSEEISRGAYELYKILRDRWHIQGKFFAINGKPIVEKITEDAPVGYRQILMKKAIYFLGSYVAKNRAVITGDSLNQTSTQRAKLLYKIYHGIEGLFLRPLIGMSKEEIIEWSKRIGTFELSSKQKEFCSIDKVVKEEASIEKIEKLFHQLKPLLVKLAKNKTALQF